MMITTFLWKGERVTSLLALIRARITHVANNVWIRVLQLAGVSLGRLAVQVSMVFLIGLQRV
jgi:hypothetical protein